MKKVSLFAIVVVLVLSSWVYVAAVPKVDFSESFGYSEKLGMNIMSVVVTATASSESSRTDLYLENEKRGSVWPQKTSVVLRAGHGELRPQSEWKMPGIIDVIRKEQTMTAKAVVTVRGRLYSQSYSFVVPDLVVKLDKIEIGSGGMPILHFRGMDLYSNDTYNGSSVSVTIGDVVVNKHTTTDKTGLPPNQFGFIIVITQGQLLSIIEKQGNGTIQTVYKINGVIYSSLDRYLAK